MNKTHLLLTLTLVSIGSFAVCDDEKLVAATQLTEVMGVESNMESGFDAMMPIINQQAAQMGLNAEEQKELQKIYKAWFLEDLDMGSVKKQIIQLYTEEFTLEELKGLKEFYLSPLGQKTLQAMPLLMKKGAAIGMKEAQDNQDKLLARLTPFLEKQRAK